MYHKQLGEKSKWAPQIEVMPDVTFFCDWKINEIMASMDPYLVSASVKQREENEENWVKVECALRKFP